MVERVLATLPGREREVLRLRFGIGTDRAHTLEEVGRHGRKLKVLLEAG